MKRRPVIPTLDLLERDLFSAPERRMLDWALSSSPSQEALDEVLRDWDIEAAPLQSVLLLAYLLKTHPELSVPEAMAPRLKGVLSFCRFQNLKLKAHFNKIARALSDAGIPFVIIKGGAMQVYRPDFPRWMADVDLLVGEKTYQQAVSLISGLGYEAVPDVHSTDFHLPGEKDGLADLHRFIYLATGKESCINDDLFRRASLRPMFQAEGLLPAPEDMVFVALSNLYHNLSERTSPGSVIGAFFDLAYLVSSSPAFDWEIIRRNAVKTGSSARIYLMGALMDRVVPGLLPERFMQADVDPAEAEALCFHLMYRRFVLSPLRLEIGEFHLPTAIRTVRPFPPYLARRAKYFFRKRFFALPAVADRILSAGVPD